MIDYWLKVICEPGGQASLALHGAKAETIPTRKSLPFCPIREIGIKKAANKARILFIADSWLHFYKNNKNEWHF